MKLAALFFLAASLAAQQPTRRALAPSASNGWARVVVDDDGADGIWIGDAEGRSVPFLWETDAEWSDIPLQTIHTVLGKDINGHPTAAFTLHAPEGFSRGDRQQVFLQFDLQFPYTPWICRVEVARRGDGGSFVTLEDEPRFLYYLSPDRIDTAITIPWDSEDFRVVLLPIQGDVPKFIGIDAQASTWHTTQKVDEILNLQVQRNKTTIPTYSLTLPGVHNLTALELNLRPPMAPVHAQAWIDYPDSDSRSMKPSYGSAAELWNLPALNSQSNHITFDGAADRLLLALPDGVEVTSATALIHHRRLFFPAEAGKAYFLHAGGLANPAPGSLGELPASSRAFYTGTGLSLGATEADPQAVVAAPDPTARLRRVLPWGVGLVILLLGFWGLRLLRKPDGTDLH